MVQLLEEYAKKHNIPIMQKDGIEFLIDFIKKNDVKNILEIGTAIGYSAISFALINTSIKVTTIERDEKRYKEAVKNVHNLNLDNQINLVFGDALETNIEGEYDLIFIDAAKAQSIKFFNKYEKLLKSNKYIVTDNLSFHGLVNSNEPMSRNLKQLVRKINDYISFLKTNKKYDTKFYEVGDGISVSYKK